VESFWVRLGSIIYEQVRIPSTSTSRMQACKQHTRRLGIAGLEWPPHTIRASHSQVCRSSAQSAGHLLTMVLSILDTMTNFANISSIAGDFSPDVPRLALVCDKNNSLNLFHIGFSRMAHRTARRTSEMPFIHAPKTISHRAFDGMGNFLAYHRHQDVPRAAAKSQSSASSIVPLLVPSM
jgi:hypothetical protein